MASCSTYMVDIIPGFGHILTFIIGKHQGAWCWAMGFQCLLLRLRLTNRQEA
jgi:hypothetical protein